MVVKGMRMGQVTRDKFQGRFLLAFAAMLWALEAPAATQTRPSQKDTNPASYIGSEACKTCHEDLPSRGFYKAFEDSPHFVTVLDTKRGPEWHGCEACHGPGRDHAEAGGDKTKIFAFKNASARVISERCLACHSSGEEHSNFERSAREKLQAQTESQ